MMERGYKCFPPFFFGVVASNPRMDELQSFVAIDVAFVSTVSATLTLLFVPVPLL